MADAGGSDRPGARARPRVVIVGAGFAGLWAARFLARNGRGDVEVLVLDRHNYHTFFPLLYQVAAAQLGPTEIAYPVRSVFRNARDVDFRLAEVERVDPVAKVVETGEVDVDYDYLILAPGSVSNFFGVEGAAEYSFPLRLMEEAMPLRRHILSRFEAADHEEDPERRRELLTFVIVGGGPTGVEFAGALAELVFGPLREDFPGLDMGEVRIAVLEATDRILPGMPAELGDYAKRRLERKGVEVRVGTAVRRVLPRETLLSDDSRITTDTVVWTAGVRGVEGPAEWGLPVGRGGRVEVEETLQVPGHPEIYVAGDLAHLEVDGAPVPGVAPAAIQGGEHAARNVLRQVQGEEPSPLVYSDPGMLAVIGRNAGVAYVRNRAFTGFFAWFLWLTVHIAKLIGFRNRLLVLVQWAGDYFFPRRSIRLILPAERETGREVERPTERTRDSEPGAERHREGGAERDPERSREP